VPQPRILVRLRLLQRVSFKTRHDATDQPARLAHLNDSDHSSNLPKWDGRSASALTQTDDAGNLSSLARMEAAEAVHKRSAFRRACTTQLRIA